MDKKVLLAIGGGVVALIAGVVGYSMMPRDNSAPAKLDASNPAVQNLNWVKQKAKEAGGDMNRLSAEDKAKVVGILGPQHAESGFKMYSTVK